ENYPGYPEGVMGPKMMQEFREQAQRFGADCRYGTVTNIEFDERPYKLTVDEETDLWPSQLLFPPGLRPNGWTWKVSSGCVDKAYPLAPPVMALSFVTSTS